MVRGRWGSREVSDVRFDTIALFDPLPVDAVPLDNCGFDHRDAKPWLALFARVHSSNSGVICFGNQL